jgi:hypothetical protein
MQGQTLSLPERRKKSDSEEPFERGPEEQDGEFWFSDLQIIFLFFCKKIICERYLSRSSGLERQKGDREMKKSHYVSAVVSVAMVVLCCPQQGYADMATLHFFGEVTSITSTSNTYSWGTDGYFRADDLFEGCYSYQSGQQPFGQGNPAVSGSYSKYKAEEISFSVGNISGAADGGYLFVYDEYSNSHKDQYGFSANIKNDNLRANGSPYTLLSFGLALIDSTESVFDTSALPLTVPTLNQFTSTRLELTFGQGLRADGCNYEEYLFVSGKVTALGQITSVVVPTSVVIPVPASLLLLGSGLIGLAGRGLRRIKK